MAVELDNQIQQEFQDGIEEVYATLLCNHLYMCFLDEANTEVSDIYEETNHKVYLPPYELIAKVTYSHPKGEGAEETVIRRANFRVPTKQFTTLGIPFLHEKDWERMRQAKFVYEGTEYLCEEVTPSTLVADLWQFFEFSCLEAKHNSIEYAVDMGDISIQGSTSQTLSKSKRQTITPNVESDENESQ